MKNKKLAIISMVAATYTVISLVLSPISFVSIQVRIAEGLNLLPLFMPETTLGVILGCLITNTIGVMNGSNILGPIDILIGTLATTISVYLISKIGPKKNIVFTMFIPVVINAILVGLELAIFLYPLNLVTGLIICVSQVAIGETCSMILGLYVIKGLRDRKIV